MHSDCSSIGCMYRYCRTMLIATKMCRELISRLPVEKYEKQTACPAQDSRRSQSLCSTCKLLKHLKTSYTQKFRTRASEVEVTVKKKTSVINFDTYIGADEKITSAIPTRVRRPASRLVTKRPPTPACQLGNGIRSGSQRMVTTVVQS